MKFLFIIFGMIPLVAQTDLYLPWVPQNDIFQSELIFNNHTDEDVIILLQAMRNAAETEEVTMTLTPRINYKVSAGELFPTLKDGSGYTVQIISDNDPITASIIISSTTTTSGNSPSRMNAIEAKKASELISFNYLPARSSGFVAPVIFNAGQNTTSATFHAYQNGQEIGTTQRSINPGEPFASKIERLFPEAQGDLYLVVESNEPLVGASFLFNAFLEPSLAPANPIAFVPNPKETLREIILATDNQILLPGQSTQIKIFGKYLQGPQRDHTQDATWTSSNPDLFSVSNSGSNKGKVTGKGYGSAIITANFDRFTETLRVSSRPPMISLERGVSCTQNPTLCESWDRFTTTVAWPDQRSLVFENSDLQVLETVRLTSTEIDFVITDIKARNFRASVPVEVTGIRVGQTIGKNSPVVFYLEIGRSNGFEADIEISITGEGRGTFFNYNFSYSSN